MALPLRSSPLPLLVAAAFASPFTALLRNSTEERSGSVSGSETTRFRYGPLNAEEISDTERIV